MEEILTKVMDGAGNNKLVAAGVMGVLALPFWVAVLFVALQIYA